VSQNARHLICADDEHGAVVGKDICRPERGLVGAEGRAIVQVSPPRWVCFRDQDGGLLRVDPSTLA